MVTIQYDTFFGEKIQETGLTKPATPAIFPADSREV